MYRMSHVNFLAPNASEQGPIWPWYSSTYLNSVTPAREVPLGAIWELQGDLKAAGGNAFKYVRAIEGLTVGQLVCDTIGTVGQVTGTFTAASSTVVSVITNITTVATDVGQPLLLYVANSTSLGGGPVYKRVVSMTGGSGGYGTNTTFVIETVDFTIATKPYGPDAFPVLPTNADIVSLIRPYQVAVNIAAATPVGVALGTVTAGNYTVIQIAGEALVMSGATTPGLVVGVQAVGTAAGLIIGSTAGANPYQGASVIIPHITYNASASVLQPCKVNFLGNQ